MVGMERSILPAIAEQEFHLAARAAILLFIVVFGVTKALTNYAAGRLGDRFGRKHVLVAGWLVAAPVPFILMWAPNWTWVLVANAFLGISQGLTWSTTVIMKIDLVGPARRGLAMGLNESAGLSRRVGRRPGDAWIAAPTGSDRSRSTLESAVISAWRFRRCSCERPAPTSRSSHACTHRRRNRAAATSSGARAWRTAISRASVRLVSSTISTTAWPGAYSPCSSRRLA